MKDVMPNFATVVMGLKDKVVGGNDSSPIFNHPEWATPQNIESFLQGKIEAKKRSLEIDLRNEQDPNNNIFDQQYQIRNLQRARNVTNAVRLNGPTAFISQTDRYHTARTVADSIVGSLYNDKDTYSPEKGKKHEEVTRLIGAALGHKRSIKELKRLKEESK